MRFVSSVAGLKRALNICSLAAGKTPSDFANLVRLQVENKVVTAMSTDLTIYAEIEIRGATADSADGSFVLPIDKLSAMCRELADEDNITISRDGDVINIHSKSGRWKLPAETKPIPSRERPGRSEFTISSEIIAQMVAWSEFVAASNVELKAAGIKIDVGDGSIRTTAMDGRRISMFKQDLEYNSQFDCRIPMNLVRMALGFKSDVQVSKIGNTVFFTSGNDVVYGTELDGKYPSVSRFWEVFNMGPGSTLDPSDLASASRGVSILSDVDTRRITLQSANDSIRITSSSHYGESETKCDANKIGNGVEAILNCKYLEQSASALGKLHDGKAEIGSNDKFFFLRGGNFAHVIATMSEAPA